MEFKKKLTLEPDKITCEEKDITSALQVAFEGEIILTNYCIENKRLDAYLPKYKAGIEDDEYDHEGRDPNYEQSRQLMIEGHEITLFRTNTDDSGFSTYKRINQIYMYISKLTEKQTKEKNKKIKEIRRNKKLEDIEDGIKNKRSKR